MHTVIHCSVNARASTGGPSSAWSRIQPSPSTNEHSPMSQSPEMSHPASPPTTTSFFTGSPASMEHVCSYAPPLDDDDLHHEVARSHSEPGHRVHVAVNRE